MCFLQVWKVQTQPNYDSKNLLPRKDLTSGEDMPSSSLLDSSGEDFLGISLVDTSGDDVLGISLSDSSGDDVLGISLIEEECSHCGNEDHLSEAAGPYVFSSRNFWGNDETALSPIHSPDDSDVEKDAVLESSSSDDELGISVEHMSTDYEEMLNQVGQAMLFDCEVVKAKMPPPRHANSIIRCKSKLSKLNKRLLLKEVT